MGGVEVMYDITINQAFSAFKSMDCNPHDFFSFPPLPLGVPERLEETGVV